MCEIVVFVRDQDWDTDDPYSQFRRYKAGDVVCVRDDGWPWGKLEISNPDWRIIKFPSMSEAAFEAFVQEQEAPDPLNPPNTLMRRALTLSFNAIPQAPSIAKNAALANSLRTTMATPSSINGILSLPMSEDDVPGLAITKDIPPDPLIIGPHETTPGVIG